MMTWSSMHSAAWVVVLLLRMWRVHEPSYMEHLIRCALLSKAVCCLVPVVALVATDPLPCDVMTLGCNVGIMHQPRG